MKANESNINIIRVVKQKFRDRAHEITPAQSSNQKYRPHLNSKSLFARLKTTFSPQLSFLDPFYSGICALPHPCLIRSIVTLL